MSYTPSNASFTFALGSQAAGKSILKTSITSRQSNTQGDEEFTAGSTAIITGAFYRKEDEWAQDRVGLFQNADAIAMFPSGTSISKNDLLTYDSESYRVLKVVTRRWGTTTMYILVQCFKV